MPRGSELYVLVRVEELAVTYGEPYSGVTTASTIGAALALALAGCSCGGPSVVDGGADTTVIDANTVDADDDDAASADSALVDVGPPDAWVCTVVPDTSPSEFSCDGRGVMGCQDWAESRGPGWDVVATCMPSLHDCSRADHCTGLELSSCTCGNGPGCDPGYVCGRPPGSTAPRTCICAWGP